MVISLTCFILGDTTDSIFTIRLSDLVIVDKTENTEVEISKLKISDLREYIWRKKKLETHIDNHRGMSLWKVNSKDKLEGVSTEEEIRTKLEGKKMDTNKLFRNEEYFLADHSSDTIENVHIIVIIPTTSGPFQQGVPQDFELFKRDDTIDVLWNGFITLSGIATRFENHDRNDKGLHPIPVLAGRPGVGKSRFLDKVEELIKKKAEKSHNNAFTNMIVINTTYGNSNIADDIDEKMKAQASLAIRILFEYFRPKHKDYAQNYNFTSFRSCCIQDNSDISYFTLDIALQIIYKDFVQINPTTPNPLLALVFGINEFNKLYIQNKDVCRNLIHAIGGSMCGPPPNIFFIPILAGTIKGPLNDYISDSIHQPLSLPLHRKAMNLFDDQYVKFHPYFQISIGDIGGHTKLWSIFTKFS
ncbi:14069_t:CDS:2 [Funneliformis geosporum]|uniref:14069_t:CDS:1 n=1 Tax=Funneliformis geosporum TaxID=1117311 RepID=A0A9W4WMK1_9GLOM|nr:14069_t:CDS:2 [Funneliformis geosporum]